MRPWRQSDTDPWDSYGYWEAWVRRHLPECEQAAWDDIDGTLQANLYSIMAGLADGQWEPKP